MAKSEKGLARKLYDGVRDSFGSFGFKVATYSVLVGAGLGLIVGCASSKPSDFVLEGKAAYADSLQVGNVYGPPTPEVYGPVTPAGFGEVYGPQTPEKIPEKKVKKRRHGWKEIHYVKDIDMDTVSTNRRFLVSMNQMENTEEKREIIMTYDIIYHPEIMEKADPKLVYEIETLDLGTGRGLDSLNILFDNILRFKDPDLGTRENEYRTQVIRFRAEYANDKQRDCFHANTRMASTLTPVRRMIDDRGKDIGIHGVEDVTPLPQGEDILGSSHDAIGEINPNTVERVILRHKDDPIEATCIYYRTLSNPYWRRDISNPEAIINYAKTAPNLDTGDPTPELKEGDVGFYFMPVPSLGRDSLFAVDFMSVNLKPFEQKEDTNRVAKLGYRQYVYGPKDVLVSADTAMLVIRGLKSIEDIEHTPFAIESGKPIYVLGDPDGEFRHAIEIFTIEDHPKKAVYEGTFGVNIDGVIPIYQGYVADENGDIQVPALGKIGDSLTLVIPADFYPNYPGVSRLALDSTGKVGLEYIVRANVPVKREGGPEVDSLFLSNVLQYLVERTIKEGRIPDTYTIPVLQTVKKQGKDYLSEVDSSLAADSVFTRDSTFTTTDRERTAINSIINPSLIEERAVMIDTLYDFMNESAQNHVLRVPLPDSIFKEGEEYNFNVEISPINHKDRMSPKGFYNKPAPVPIQLGKVPKVKMVRKIPGKE